MPLLDMRYTNALVKNNVQSSIYISLLMFGLMYVTNYTKKTYHKVVVFSTCVYFMHHGGDMEKIL